MVWGRLIAYLDGVTTEEGAAVKPHIVHRLDMDTSGVVIFAKSPEAANHLCAQFRERTASKSYIALCVGAPVESVFKVWYSRRLQPRLDVSMFLFCACSEHACIRIPAMSRGSKHLTPYNVVRYCQAYFCAVR